ncbi:uncharacterized protein TM35_000411420, partial [Trypanosoma theileri]
GARHSGKTSFAFQSAVNSALEGRRVIVMCCEHVLCSKLPQPLTPLCNLDKTALGRIEFVYVESIAEVVRELSTWMTPQDVPALVIVDDDSFTDAGDARRTAQLLAALENVYEWMTRHANTHTNGTSAVGSSAVGVRFHYVLVSNNFPERSQGAELPFSAFPLVCIYVGSTGSVVVHTMETDRTEVRPLQLEWDNGLILRTA